MNYATDTPTKLDENHVQELTMYNCNLLLNRIILMYAITSTLKEVFAMDYVRYPDEARDMLLKAHSNFHVS